MNNYATMRREHREQVATADPNTLNELFERQKKELEAAIRADKRGNGFVLEMFRKELNAHEYGWTGEIKDALDALGLTLAEVKTTPNLKYGLALAMASFN